MNFTLFIIFASLPQEYENETTPEAKYVKDLDKFDMILQAFEYEQAENTPMKLQEFFDSTNGKSYKGSIFQAGDILDALSFPQMTCSEQSITNEYCHMTGNNLLLLFIITASWGRNASCIQALPWLMQQYGWDYLLEMYGVFASPRLAWICMLSIYMTHFTSVYLHCAILSSVHLLDFLSINTCLRFGIQNRLVTNDYSVNFYPGVLIPAS